MSPFHPGASLKSMDECLFCKIAADETPADLVYADDEFLAFRDIHPQAPVHALVVPRTHYADMADYARSDPDAVGRYLQRAADVAQELGVADDGYRLVLNTGAMAGQSVPHVHVHVLGGRPLLWPPG